MPSITLKYNEGGTDYSRYFGSVLSVNGFKPSDHHVVFPQLRQEFLDGTVRAKKAGFRRVFTIDMIVTDADDLLYIGSFLNAEAQYVSLFTYDSTNEADVRVVATNDSEYSSEWIDGVELGRKVRLVLEEAAIRQTYPIGTVPTPALDNATMWFKKRIQITGTPTSPQTLTFGTGVLATDESGGSFPTVDNGTEIYRVEVDAAPYQEGKVYLASTPSINGSDYVTFTIAHSEAGNAYSDGNYYADITLWKKAR